MELVFIGFKLTSGRGYGIRKEKVVNLKDIVMTVGTATQSVRDTRKYCVSELPEINGFWDDFRPNSYLLDDDNGLNISLSKESFVSVLEWRDIKIDMIVNE